MKKLILILALLTLTAQSFAMTQLQKKQREVELAFEAEEMAKEIAESANLRSSISKTLGYFGIGIIVPAIALRMTTLPVLRMGATQAEVQTWRAKNINLIAIMFTSFSVSEFMSLKNFMTMFVDAVDYDIYGDQKEELEQMIKEAEAKMTVKQKLTVLAEMKIQLNSAIKKLFTEEELDGSWQNALLDRVTFGGVAAEGTEKLYAYRKGLRMIAEKELELMTALAIENSEL